MDQPSIYHKYSPRIDRSRLIREVRANGGQLESPLWTETIFVFVISNLTAGARRSLSLQLRDTGAIHVVV